MTLPGQFLSQFLTGEFGTWERLVRMVQYRVHEGLGVEGMEEVDVDVCSRSSVQILPEIQDQVTTVAAAANHLRLAEEGYR